MLHPSYFLNCYTCTKQIHVSVRAIVSCTPQLLTIPTLIENKNTKIAFIIISQLLSFSPPFPLLMLVQRNKKRGSREKTWKKNSLRFYFSKYIVFGKILPKLFNIPINTSEHKVLSHNVYSHFLIFKKFKLRSIINI